MEALEQILKKIEIIFKLLELKEKSKGKKVDAGLDKMITIMLLVLDKEIQDLKKEYKVSDCELKEMAW